jgi:P-type Ca2+ transporter type 2C
MIGAMTAEGSAASGLTGAEATRRLASIGANEIPSAPRRSWIRRLGTHLLEPMSALLIIAAAIDGLALGERVQAIAILAIVGLNAVIGTVQEGRAQRALDALRSMEPRYATVIRDGTRARIPLQEVVPGDLVVLATGDRVPADVELVSVTNLEVDESILTGESLPVAKALRPNGNDPPSRAFAGTIVVSGEGLGTATATGASSSLGRIAAELGVEPTPTPLQRQLGRLSRTLGVAAVAVALGVFALTLVRFGLGEEQLREAFLSSVALAVAAVPEGLPAVVTVVLALGVRAMAERGAIVRRLPAVETLGSADVILSDKTGTLTENRMRADRFMVPGIAPDVDVVPDALREAIALGCDATLEPSTGDPVEVAMLEAIGADRVRMIRSGARRLASIPFDAGSRRTVTLSERGANLIAVIKGAPEVVLGASVDAWGRSDGSLDREEVLRDVEALASSGSRVIAFGVRTDDEVSPAAAPEEGFSFLGLVGLHDPVRAEAASAVADAAAAGIRVVMVTGDHAGTAAAVGRDVGLFGPGDRIVDGGDPGARDAIGADDVRIYARVLPTDKLHIVRAYQDGGAIVAVTGDGVNDAPALRQADIGVAMGRTGSDVAREAADMVITDDDLGTIVRAIGEGRRIFGNIRKVIDYLVAGNLSEVTVVVGALLLAPAAGVPLTPLQLLWINLLTDGLPAIALGTGPAADRSPGAIRATSLLSWPRARVLAARAALIAFVSLGVLFLARSAFDASWEASRTAMFTVLVMSQALYAFVVQLDRPGRSPAPVASLLKARGLLLAVGLGIVLQLIVVVMPGAGIVLDTTTLTISGWLLCGVASVIPPLVMWVTGWTRHRSARASHAA